jgi:hypothetical protein
MNADSVRKLDARILELAKYEVSKGGLRLANRQQIAENFRYFKYLIMSKETTVDQLDDMVRGSHGDPDGRTVLLEDLGIREHTDADLSSMPSCEVFSVLT